MVVLEILSHDADGLAFLLGIGVTLAELAILFPLTPTFTFAWKAASTSASNSSFEPAGRD